MPRRARVRTRRSGVLHPAKGFQLCSVRFDSGATTPSTAWPLMRTPSYELRTALAEASKRDASDGRSELFVKGRQAPLVVHHVGQDLRQTSSRLPAQNPVDLPGVGDSAVHVLKTLLVGLVVGN